MKISRETKLVIIIFVVYFFLAWILSSNYFLTHMDSVGKVWENWHNSIMTGESGGHNQFRLISFWAAEGVSKFFGQSIFASYLLIRFFFTFLTFCVFHLFLLKWFSHKTAMMSVFLLAAITPITYLPYLQEADVVMNLFFIGGLWLIRERKLWALLAVLAIGTLAKETIVLLVPFYFFLHWKKEDKYRVVAETVGLALVWGLMFYVSRNAFYEGGGPDLIQLPHNIKAIKNYLKYNPLVNIYTYYLPLLGVFWVLPFIKLKNKPYFFRRVPIYIIFFITFHFVFAWPEECRLILPLAFLAIPAGIITLFPESFQPENKKLGA